jgi:signal transduction histidine kinase
MILGNATASYADLVVPVKERGSNCLPHGVRKHLIRNVVLRRELQRRERNRIARELHDTCFQGLASALFLLDNAAEEMRPDSSAKSSVSRATQILREALEEGRTILQGLRSSKPDPTSLEHALAALRAEFGVDPNVRFRIFVVGQQKRLQPGIQKEIYLIGREAIINAFRHSRARRVEAEIEYLRRRVRLLVRDNGCGIAPEIIGAGRRSHWGLLGMRERARAIGANLRIWSRPGRGTEIELSV